MVVDIHQPPSKPPQSPARSSRRLTVVSLADIKAFQKLAGEIKVLDEEGAVEEVERNKVRLLLSICAHMQTDERLFVRHSCKIR